ncbi:MAG TPA: aspartate aminotransferase [Peptococcaceae bacterium]|nr:MAG: aspartate transaminase [Clostridia bacterium 41_269]HBT19832.1 aspartate aminotransferase [Peptococcaceae bacterium]
MLPKRELIKISDKAETISPFIVMDVLEKAKEMERKGKRIIHLEIGEPDFDTPEPIKKAAEEALKEGFTHYTHSQGLLELREEISHYYYKTYGVEVDSDRIIVTSGTSPAMLLVLSAVVNPGDEVLLTDPYYSCYPNFINYVGGKPITIKVFEEDGFRLSINEVKRHISPKTRALIINSPSNPTGVIMPPEDLEALADLPLTVVSDEIYHGLTYGENARSMLEFSSKAIVINGFSKLFAMTGWRLGYAIVPPELVRPIRNMQQNLFICAASFVQKAGIAALKYCGEHVEKMRQEYDRRRKFTLEKIKETGLKVASSPTGAFYILANARDYSMDSYNLAFDILEKVGVAVTPGIDFGPNAEGYLRISYANSIENIAEGMERLKRYFNSFK